MNSLNGKILSQMLKNDKVHSNYRKPLEVLSSMQLNGMDVRAALLNMSNTSQIEGYQYGVLSKVYNKYFDTEVVPF